MLDAESAVASQGQRTTEPQGNLFQGHVKVECIVVLTEERIAGGVPAVHLVYGTRAEICNIICIALIHAPVITPSPRSKPREYSLEPGSGCSSASGRRRSLRLHHLEDREDPSGADEVRCTELVDATNTGNSSFWKDKSAFRQSNDSKWNTKECARIQSL
jgi:hypothetical protein